MTPAEILDIIAKLEMTKEEADAFRFACTYEHLFHSVFPTIPRRKRGNGDPRTKSVFKHAMKAIQQIEQRGRINPKDYICPADYKLFIYAQLKILKNNFEQGKVKWIDHNCLIGNQAWARWTVFREKFKKAEGVRSAASVVDQHKLERVKEAFANTKDYLNRRFGRLDKEDILTSLERGSLQRWVSLKMVSPYYVWHSPVVRQWLMDKGYDTTTYFGQAVGIYKEGVTAETTREFEKEFQHEREPCSKSNEPSLLPA